MPSQLRKHPSGIMGLWRKYKGPPTQASLFHYIKEEPEEGIDWSPLRHPIQFLKEEWQAPRTRASLFQYIEEPAEPIEWRAFLRDLVFGSPPPPFIPTLLSDPLAVAVAPWEYRKSRRRSLLLSVGVHFLIAGIAIFLVYHNFQTFAPKEPVVFVSSPFFSPFESTGPDGGGGGGGGKREKTPPAPGRMPDTSRLQFMAPDPTEPKPLEPAEDLKAMASIWMPIDIRQDQALAIGDVEAPPNSEGSSGPGSGGGIGTGTGTGVGSGIGPGVGPGEGGGMGGGRGGGIGNGVGPYVVGNGVFPPTPIVQPLPVYTEEGRKARVEGIVLLQAVVRKDGTVDSFKVLKGLGYGLDESAINTIATKWRFKPGSFKGQPVDVKANIEVSFRLY